MVLVVLMRQFGYLSFQLCQLKLRGLVEILLVRKTSHEELHGGVLELQGLECLVPLTHGLLQGIHNLGDLHAGGGGILSDGVQLIPGVPCVPACWHQT